MIDSQLTFDPVHPKEGSVKFAVWHLLMTHKEGICRRDAVNWIDCYELSARIGELEKDGWPISKGRCDKHYHKQRFVQYYLER